MNVSKHWIDEISAYHDGELSPAEHAACEAHLADCPECRAALEEIRMVIASAAADVDTLPRADLWPGILARLDSAPEEPRVLSWKARRVSFTLPQLALAASVLIAISASVAYFAAGTAGTAPGLQEAPIQAQAEPIMPPSADVTPANFADAQFDQAVQDLERVLVEQRDQLDPRTVMVIERNLAAIDQAIRQARAALDADPANQFLNSHLADARRRKLELLRYATTIAPAGGN